MLGGTGRVVLPGVNHSATLNCKVELDLDLGCNCWPHTSTTEVHCVSGGLIICGEGGQLNCVPWEKVN